MASPGHAPCLCRRSPIGRLTSLKGTLGSLKPRISRATDVEGHSPQAEPWRKWYSLARWKRLRALVLLRDLFTCQWPGCGRVEQDTSKLVADHVTPHRGDPALFWGQTNVQTLCKPCHDRRKQAQERRAGR
jgi:5-methylcytosine-specific restriction protein A